IGESVFPAGAHATPRRQDGGGAGSSTRDSVQEFRQHYWRIEERLRDLSRRAAVSFVVGVDGGQRFGCFLHSGEAEDTVAVGKERARTRVLHHRRLARGEITQRSVAHPRALKSDVRGFRATELAARRLDIGAV